MVSPAPSDPSPNTFTRLPAWTKPRFAIVSGSTEAPASKIANRARLTHATSVRARSLTNKRRKPRLGSRRCNGICPPSYDGGVLPPLREPLPLCPRPAVLPCPEPMPRPIRLMRWVEPSAGCKSDRSIYSLVPVCTSNLCLPGWVPRLSRRLIDGLNLGFHFGHQV